MSELTTMIEDFLQANDFSRHTDRAFRSDIMKFERWFTMANDEQFDPARVTVRDVADFRDHLSRVRRQSVATVNRAIVAVRRFLGHLKQRGVLPENPAASVRELRRMPTVPKGLSMAEVRKLLREIEIRQDHRAGAILGLMLFSGLRVSELVGLTLSDLTIQPRTGQAVCRHGKGNKQRIIPLPLEARRQLTRYIESRPCVESNQIFIGERGALSSEGIRGVCLRYSAITGVKFTPHTLRHTFAHRFLTTTNNDIVALAQILGHESLNTTAIYTRRPQEELLIRVDEMRYG